MFIGDHLFRWDQPATNPPDLPRAIALYGGNLEKQAQIQGAQGEDPAPWMTWKGAIAWSPKTAFAHGLDFFVNVPWVQEDLTQPEIYGTWYWHGVTEKTLDQLFPDDDGDGFADSPQMYHLLKAHLNPRSPIVQGWTVAKNYGRIDGDCTYSDFTYLLESDRHYLFMRNYQEVLH